MCAAEVESPQVSALKPASMNGLPVPMGAENPYAAEVVAARQRIARLKDRLAQRAAARRNLLSDKEATLGPLTEAPPVILHPPDC